MLYVINFNRVNITLFLKKRAGPDYLLFFAYLKNTTYMLIIKFKIIMISLKVSLLCFTTEFSSLTPFSPPLLEATKFLDTIAASYSNIKIMYIKLLKYKFNIKLFK